MNKAKGIKGGRGKFFTSLVCFKVLILFLCDQLLVDQENLAQEGKEVRNVASVDNEYPKLSELQDSPVSLQAQHFDVRTGHLDGLIIIH